MEDVGRKLRLLRKGKGLTQRDVSDRLGMVRATLSNYEVGRRTPHLSDLRRLAEFYGVGLEYFGVAEEDEVFSLLTRARDVFASDLPKEQKDEVYKELMRIYLSIKE